MTRPAATGPSIRGVLPDTGGPRSDPPSAVITASIGLMAGVIWLALPELAVANDCFTAGEVLDCVLTTPPVLFGLLGGALLGAALWGAMSGPPQPDEEASEEDDGDDLPPELFRRRRPPPDAEASEED